MALDYTKLVDKEALLYVWQKIKAKFALKTDVPTKVSQLTNDSGYKTTDTTYSDVTTTVHGLMSTDDKTKLNSIADGAEVNVNADWSATEGDAVIRNKPNALSQFTNDGHFVTDANYVHTDNNLTAALVEKINAAGDSMFTGSYTDLTNKPDLTQYQTATQVETAIASATTTAVRYKGSVASVDKLPTTGQKTGDLYNITATGMNTVWNGTAWDDQAPTVDLSGYVQTADLDEITNTEIDTICV